MKRSRNLVVFVSAWSVLALLACAGRGPAAESQERPPNVILVMPDDQGYGDLGCHGHPLLRTPHLDALHGRSVRLTDFHVDPTCSPTRSALMTGRYSARTGVWHTIMGRSILRADEVTMADVFASSGYATGMFGKWHLGDNYPYRPQDRGFQEVLAHGGGGVGQTPDYWGNTYFDDTYWHNGKPEKQKGYCTDVFFSAALGFIEKNKDRPFFAYVPTNAAHGPFRAPPEYARPFKDRGVNDRQANFFGMIVNIDDNMGRLLGKLNALGIEKNTIVIFMTDNGTAAGSFNDGMRGKKGSQYNGGHRVPCFIHWPGRIEGGRDLDPVTAHVDLLPTLVDLCGLKRPEGVKLDGTSLRPLIEGKAWPERTLMVQSQRIEHPQKWRKCAVMTDRWHYVDGKELYDMEADPSQKKNVAADRPEVVKRLRKVYEDLWEGMKARFGEYVSISIGSEKENPARLTGHDWHGQRVPWNQSHIRSAKTGGNGFWAVKVERAGTYDLTLRRWPKEEKKPIPAAKARLTIGPIDETKPIPAGAEEVTFRVKLPAGETRLQTWFTNESGKSWGAYFIYVRYDG